MGNAIYNDGELILSGNDVSPSDIYNNVGEITGTFTDLQNLINNAEDNLVLPYDFAYNAEFDSDLVDGVVINKEIFIDGNGYTISGSDSARIFSLNDDATLTLDTMTLKNGNADLGGALEAVMF